MLIFAQVAILVSVLIVSTCISAFLTIGAVSTYIFLRLAFLTRQHGLSTGLAIWADEVYGRAAYTIGMQRRTVADDTRSETTNESGVMVQEFGNRSPENPTLYNGDSEVKIEG